MMTMYNKLQATETNPWLCSCVCFREENFGSLDIPETLMNKIDFPQKPIFLCDVVYTFLIWHRITLSNLHEIRQNIIAEGGKTVVLR